MPGWFKVPAAAKYADCSPRLFRDWLKQGLRHVRIRGTIRTKADWIDEFLMKGEIHQDQVANIVDDVCKELL